MNQPPVTEDMAALKRRTEELDALNSVATILKRFSSSTSALSRGSPAA